MPVSLPLCFDAIIKSNKAYVREVAPVRAQSSLVGVRAGVLSPLGCRPSWTTAMELSANYLQEKLQRDPEAEHAEVEDTTFNRCACSFRVLVVSAKFEEKPLLQRHRLVNACLAEELPHIHAFEQKTLTPEQWAREQQK
ncbi:bolA-like protein 2 [Hylobates moloch]|uniref:bolA-like protein 2 n=1 Tax=Hylobates moloch TaxID=81572 RepID=UPI002676C456|nr:bolA-like protein 2 [Hylobates moloch]